MSGDPVPVLRNAVLISNLFVPGILALSVLCGVVDHRENAVHHSLECAASLLGTRLTKFLSIASWPLHLASARPRPLLSTGKLSSEKPLWPRLYFSSD